jgi:hypothetical protein
MNQRFQERLTHLVLMQNDAQSQAERDAKGHDRKRRDSLLFDVIAAGRTERGLQADA